MFHGLQNLNLLALLPDPQTVVRSALWQQLAHDGLKDEPLNPALHGVSDFAGFQVRVSIFRIYTKPRHGAGFASPLPGVQRALEVVATAQGPAMESEFFPGAALNPAETRAWSLGEFLRCAREIADVVRSLHAEGITHRDLVPANILRRPDGAAVCVIDFGLATRATSVTHDPVGARLIEGTLGYLAPEQTGRLNRPVDRRADLYTLGATFFALLTGRAPFEGADPVALVHATVALPAPRVDALRPDAPAPLAALIARLLAKMPDDRYQTADALARDLGLLDDAWRARGSLDDVDLSADDRPDHLVLPDRLYGREGARHDLQDAVARLRAGAGSAIAVVGPAGAGKTALVRELHRILADTDAAFAEGKVDPLQRGTPYAPVLAVLRALVQRALAGDDARWFNGATIDFTGAQTQSLFDALVYPRREPTP